jgi:hypothetical protein
VLSPKVRSAQYNAHDQPVIALNKFPPGRVLSISAGENQLFNIHREICHRRTMILQSMATLSQVLNEPQNAAFACALLIYYNFF